MKKNGRLFVALFLFSFTLLIFQTFQNENLPNDIGKHSQLILPTEIILINDQTDIAFETIKAEELEEEKNENENFIQTNLIKDSTDVYYSAGYFMSAGIIYHNGGRWTWYSQKVLPGEGLAIPGRHVDENGYVCDENDYICLASSSLGYGTVVDTPFGKMGKVYDSGCDYDILDVYTDW